MAADWCADRVLGPAGGAWHGRRAGQGRRYAGQFGGAGRLARAALAQAERTHASNERLAAQAFISPIALETSRTQLDSARAQLDAAQASLDVTRVGLREAALVAPIDGIVAKRHVVPGEKVANEQPLLTIVDLARLELAGVVGTHEVARLAPGMPVQVRVEGAAAPVQGRLARIAPAAEAGTRSIGVTIELANPGHSLRAGQYALARVDLPDDRPRLTLPIPAVGNSGGQDHLWIIENGVLVRRVVTLGRRDEAAGRVEVLTALVPDAQVLAARFDNLREGAKAVVVAGKSPPIASAAASATAPAR
jgi:membrane fusion protein, multidrug efflux system